MAGGRPTPLQINCSQSVLEDRDSYTVNNGRFEKDGITVGPHGIMSQSPDECHTFESVYAISDFELLEVLGRGASSKCQKAIHRPSNQTMALKIITMDDANKRKQLVTELRTLVGASCKQFVNMLDAFFHDGTVYIALEYMDGGSIDNIQTKAGVRIPEAPLSFMLREMLIGLSVLHEQRNQVHRDIKPGNVLFNSLGDVKLGDFGISKTLNTWGGKQQASTYVGTSLYMSPERLQGQSYSYTSDVWSVGIMAVELATGKYPYDTTGGLYALMGRVLESPPPVPPAGEFSPAFCDFIAHSLHPDAQIRPAASALLTHAFLTQPSALDQDGFRAWMHSVVC
eukprot:TRINITY_DN131_c0_g1_i1.p1 TRINITY_DN131_c0_g1~~TRINITY_DN131_c0_g1_i1.p1  ORF type:complete len:340 (+),score=53.26 TRINITY_DN131_c0_g1_i1:217-1236(+)